MAVPNPQLRYATVSFDANGTTTDWEVSFTGGYIDASYIYAYSGVLDSDTGLLSDQTSHDVTVISEAANAATVRISPAVASGRKLFIYRSTPVAAMLVDYVNGSLPSKANMNLANEQLLDIIQEMMDNLNLTNSVVNDQIGTIIDLNTLIQQIYQQVIDLLAAGGIVSVAPKTWAGTWLDDTTDDQEFDIVGADVADAGFYDVYINGIGQEPGVDYAIFLPAAGSADNPYIRFTTVPSEGSVWFAVLRGYAKPYTGTTPITESDLRIPQLAAAGPIYYVDGESEFGLINCTYSAGCSVSINSTGPSNTMATGSYFSVIQRGGQVVIMSEGGANIVVPVGCLPQTRALNSIVSAVCIDADTNTWVLSGDLAKDS